MHTLNPYLETAYPLFEATLLLKNGMAGRTLDELRLQVIKRFDEFERNCLAKGLAVEDSQSVKYALTAFIDEVALNTQDAASSSWLLEPLQLEFFGEHMGGEGFFNKLSMLRQQANVDILEIYFLCLQLGFSGIYAMHGIDKLRAMQVDLRSQLDGLRKDKDNLLSVDVLPEIGIFSQVSKAIPLWILSSVFISLIFIFYFTFSLVIDSRANKSTERINSYYESHKGLHYKKLIS